MTLKKMIIGLAFDIFAVIFGIVSAIICKFFNDTIKCTCMIICSVAWGIRTMIHLVELVEFIQENQDKE